MIGGSIPGATKTISIAIFDEMQAFNSSGAGLMSALLLLFSFSAIFMVYLLNNRLRR